MSYMAPATNNYQTKPLEVAMFRWSAATQGVPVTLTADASTWAVAPVVSGNQVTLPAGHYYAFATCGLSRTAAAQNVLFQFYLNASAVGKTGQSDMYLSDSGLNVDTAECAFTVLTGQTGVFDLRVIGVESSIPTITADSALVLMRSNV